MIRAMFVLSDIGVAPLAPSTRMKGLLLRRGGLRAVKETGFS